jgi:hypothetical protein
LAYTVVRDRRRTSQGHDAIVWSERGAQRQQVRLISVRSNGTWQRYLTNALDPLPLPPAYALALYGQRWRSEMV